MRADGDVFGMWRLREVTLPAIAPLVAKDTVFASCVIVLSTPPASACICRGKTDVIIKFDIVKSASPPIGLKIIAGNAHAQYDHWGCIMDMRKIPAAVSNIPHDIAQPM